MSNHRTIFPAFNARNLKPEEVAETFVPHETFFKLLENNHALLMGPRGSGKTTMLKMLSQRALQSWKDPQAVQLVNDLPFVAVYIPTDVHWSNQVRYTEQQLSSCRNLAQLVSKVAVTTNILQALSLAFSDRLTYERVETEQDYETQFCELLIPAWRLPACLPRVDAIQYALRLRMSETILIANKVMHASEPDAELTTLPDWYFLDYLEAVSVACEAFDYVVPFKKLKWALCFDELELAPKWLPSRLVSEIRSTNERLLFKLSTSPIPDFLGATQASPRQDFTQLYLWSHSGQDPRPFCEKIITSLLERSGVHEPNLKEIFGSSLSSDTTGSEEVDEYAEGTAFWTMTRDLAQADDSLRQLLLKHDISPDNPTTNDPIKRNQVLRKIKPIVLLRHEFGKYTVEGKRVGRSRKSSTAYQGLEAICGVSDGNPRWLIGMISDLLAEHTRLKPTSMRVPDELQARVLDRASRQFRSLIFTIPTKADYPHGPQRTLFDTLREIRMCFYRKLVLEDFPLDPIGSFVIDSDTSPEIVNSLREAAYYGAIVYVDPTEHPFDSELSNRRFRLSYILSPIWRLPIRLYSAIRLSKCLPPQRTILKEPDTGQIQLTFDFQE